MTDDISVSAAPIGASESTPSTPVENKVTSQEVTTESSISSQPTPDDFDENIIPESSRDNFRKYRESQAKKYSETQAKLNEETRKRMEFESRWNEYQSRQQAAQNQPQDPGKKPVYTDFSTVEEFQEATAKWAKQVAINEYRGTLTQQQQLQRQQAEAEKMAAKGATARAKYPDFDAVVKPIAPIANQIPSLIQFINEFDNGTDVLYHLGKNPSALETLKTLQPFAAGQELLRIQAAISAPPPKAISQAPAPINPVNTGGDGSVKSILEQVKKDDVSDFVARENRKLLRGRRGE